jgi:hypothetical protein
MSGCVDNDPSALLCLGAHDAVMTALTKGAIKNHNSTKIMQLTKEKQRSTKHHTENQRMDNISIKMVRDITSYTS